MSWLLDTPVVSELVRAEPDPGLANWLNSQDENTLNLSVLTIGELEKGIAKLPDSRRKTTLRKWVRSDLLVRFEQRVLVIDHHIVSQWGILVGTSERKGNPLPVIDSLISATALAHGLTVVTRNLSDFKRCGAPCLNPWSQ